ncbi:TetR/AcrR family transcriptional regulator [Euzebya tangerina]|uniref:TetR/AcrR family transcriptional regulator n=1 Tax=Euzebya tangerina TaxID=591198 RepID=UPI0013C2DC6E|nr:TetR/AcrR family transcriptional regulator [Euzebya tangerina]
MRDPLTTDRIVTAAVALADEVGMGGLTMRRLATTLGYEVMSLYNHVANKEELVTRMIDAVAAELPRPDPQGPWKAELRRAMIGGLRVLQAHPWVVPLLSTRVPGPARLDVLEAFLATLASASLTPERMDHGFHALNNHLEGFALQEQSYTLPSPQDDGAEAFLEDFKRTLDVERFPWIMEHIRWHETGPESQEFEFVLDLILDGLDGP